MKPTPPATGPRYEALIQLLRTAEGLWNTSRRFFIRWDLGPSQFNILNLLREAPAEGWSQSELSRQLIMHRSNVTGLVDRLEARGLVRRSADVADRRKWRIVLTAAGHKLLAEILPEYYRAAQEVWHGVPADRARQLVKDLEQITANADCVVQRLEGGK